MAIDSDFLEVTVINCVTENGQYVGFALNLATAGIFSCKISSSMFSGLAEKNP